MDLLRKAARDPNMLAIKMTLYRVGQQFAHRAKRCWKRSRMASRWRCCLNSRLGSTKRATSNGRVRSNAKAVHVVYGLLGLKVHCKIALIVRREQRRRVRRYACIIGHRQTPDAPIRTARLSHGLWACSPADPGFGRGRDGSSSTT